MIRVLIVAALVVLAAGQAQAQVAPCQYAQNVAHFDAVATRGARRVPVRIYYPVNYRCEASVVAVSHGGEGQPLLARDYGYMEFYGERLAHHGFVALIVRHYVSVVGAPAYRDRPADITTLLDALDARSIRMPVNFRGTLNLTRVGHLGHSFGAFTGEALAGLDVVEWDGSRFSALEDFGRDPRIAAIVAISPQGPGSVGQVDFGAIDSSWSDIATPTYMLVGADEAAADGGVFVSPGWRTTGFYRMPADGTRFLSVLPDQSHGEMGGDGAPPVKRFLIENALLFFDILRNGRENPCRIGGLDPLPGMTTLRKQASGIAANASTC